jgi:hypothetical protein
MARKNRWRVSVEPSEAWGFPHCSRELFVVYPDAKEVLGKIGESTSGIWVWCREPPSRNEGRIRVGYSRPHEFLAFISVWGYGRVRGRSE